MVATGAVADVATTCLLGEDPSRDRSAPRARRSVGHSTRGIPTQPRHLPTTMFNAVQRLVIDRSSSSSATRRRSGLEQPPAHLGLCCSGLPLHTHRANGRSRGAAAGPGQLRAAAASSEISGLSSYCAAEDGARAPRPSALDECRTRHPPSTGSRHGARNTGACG